MILASYKCFMNVTLIILVSIILEFKARFKKRNEKILNIIYSQLSQNNHYVAKLKRT